ncbi:DNA-deoxyinosine glycosylase [Catenovulum sp. SM1970]|uniref:DNA-deoxyinosine glycosylase n=1 Tax=Marinifaba aquimaris TaxID=2741323 RepID=UPI001573D4F1|nr:DNA-deoxyinosine glycosylase [Marinifaba aquimaris]NTS78261.1 DNA-deoxyinosine glycosylase [Marinifaba aquimaris]
MSEQKTTNLCESFNYIAKPDAKVLILGSMPGVKSLTEQQYYAHPRNAFWPIMAELFVFSKDLPYHERLSLLTRQKVALWDVLASCERKNSLDSDIVESSIEANDFNLFLAHHPEIKAIFFNGGKAWQSFKRYVQPQNLTLLAPIHLEQLPSTSPAHASIKMADKMKVWHQAIKPFLLT